MLDALKVKTIQFAILLFALTIPFSSCDSGADTEENAQVDLAIVPLGGNRGSVKVTNSQYDLTFSGIMNAAGLLHSIESLEITSPRFNNTLLYKLDDQGMLEEVTELNQNTSIQLERIGNDSTRAKFIYANGEGEVVSEIVTVGNNELGGRNVIVGRDYYSSTVTESQESKKGHTPKNIFFETTCNGKRFGTFDVITHAAVFQNDQKIASLKVEQEGRGIYKMTVEQDFDYDEVLAEQLEAYYNACTESILTKVAIYAETTLLDVACGRIRAVSNKGPLCGPITHDVEEIVTDFNNLLCFSESAWRTKLVDLFDGDNYKIRASVYERPFRKFVVFEKSFQEIDEITDTRYPIDLGLQNCGEPIISDLVQIQDRDEASYCPGAPRGSEWGFRYVDAGGDIDETSLIIVQLLPVGGNNLVVDLTDQLVVWDGDEFEGDLKIRFCVTTSQSSVDLEFKLEDAVGNASNPLVGTLSAGKSDAWLERQLNLDTKSSDISRLQ